MSHKIAKLNAIADTPVQPLRNLPGRMTASTLLGTFQKLGFNVPTTIETKVTAGELGKAVNFKISVKDLDAALAKTQLSISDRLKLKYSASQAGILA
jgi:hypothetical protein